MDYISLGILAHVDAGKTTLSENLLYKCGSIRKLGSVDKKDSFLDNDNIERNRGITIYSKEAIFDLDNKEFTLIDTPGHIDFTTEMERTLSVLDYAIVVISSTDGIQSQTEKIKNYLTSLSIPSIIFVNKMDLSYKDKNELLLDLKNNYSSKCVDFSESNISTLNDSLSLINENFMNKVINDEEITNYDISCAVERCELIPCIFGSANKGNGIDSLINCLSSYCKAKEYSKDFAAKIYKVNYDENGNKLSHIKVTGGSLKIKDTVIVNSTEESKIEQIRLYSGLKYKSVNEVTSGQVCTVLGIKNAIAGDYLGYESKNDYSLSEPVLEYRMLSNDKLVDNFTLYSKIKHLSDEDPTLGIYWNEKDKEIVLQLMGDIQKEVLKQKILDLYSIDVSFDKPSIIYKETIEYPVVGVGHFEPLRHYSEVHLLIEPAEPGSGIISTSKCSVNILSKNWQNLILTHINEKAHKGVLTGSKLTDVKISIVNGRAHPKHTEGGDFRQATYRAIRQGLMQSKSILLEPFYVLDIKLPNESVGRFINDIEAKFGTSKVLNISDNITELESEVPASTYDNYTNEILSYTKGKGIINIRTTQYKKCHNQDEVIKKYNYNPEADYYNTPDSVFCANGTSNIVNWKDVPSYMHLEPYNLNNSSIKNEVSPINVSVKKTANTFSEKIEEDKLLTSIFEMTYGPQKKKKIEEKKVYQASVKETDYSKIKPKPIKPTCLLVDGYNIIYSWPEFKNLIDVNFDLARKQLIDMLSNYQAYKDITLILVFDAYKVAGGHRNIEKSGNMYVVYTKEKETADTYIEKTTYELSDKYSIKVATSDYQEQLIVLGKGAIRISSNEFHDIIEKTSKEINDLIK